jgi:signal transduction histidine kinase
MRVTDATAGTIALHDPRTGKLVFRHVAGEKRDELLGYELSPDEGVIGSVFQSGEGRITPVASGDPDHTPRVDEHLGYTTRNMVTVALKTMDGQAAGAMQLLNKQAGSFEQPDLEVAGILGAQLASAIENQRLHEQTKAAEIAHMLGDISHDIKNLMTPIITGVQTLQPMLDDMFSDLDRIAGEIGDGARESITEACAFVRGFLPEAFEMLTESSLTVQARVKELSDAVKGEISEPKFELADPAEVIARVIATLGPLAEAKKIALAHQDFASGSSANIDKGRLFNAVYNLVINAIPETPPGGSITVRTRATDTVYEITVADTGKGIPPEVCEKLFTDQAVSTKPGGTGLGTRIVRKVVDAHGGRIRIESRLGEGATFTITLPLGGIEAAGAPA